MNDEKQLATKSEQVGLRESFDGDYFNGMIKMAGQLYKGGAFQKSIKSAEQAFTIIQAGYEQGLGPVESLNSFYIVNGAIRPYGPALTKQLRKHGWSVKIGKHDNTVCHVTVSKHDESYEYEATKEEVAALKSQALSFAPKDKLYYHAISRIVRYYIPDVMSSVTAVYEATDGDAYDNSKHYADVPEPIDVMTPDEEDELIKKWKEVIDKLDDIEKYDDVMKAAIKEDASRIGRDKGGELMAHLSEKIESLTVGVKKEVVNPIVDQETGEVIEEGKSEQASIPTE